MEDSERIYSGLHILNDDVWQPDAFIYPAQGLCAHRYLASSDTQCCCEPYVPLCAQRSESVPARIGKCIGRHEERNSKFKGRCVMAKEFF